MGSESFESRQALHQGSNLAFLKALGRIYQSITQLYRFSSNTASLCDMLPAIPAMTRIVTCLHYW